jgi:probable rRNA maturation factor
LSLTLEIQDARWRKRRGISARLKKAVRATLLTAGADETAALTLLLTTDKRVQALNRDFRGLDKPTNVLSFPAGERNPKKCEAVLRKIARPTKEPDYIGDIAIAYGVTAKEAKASGKTLLDHATHLTVHGVLHLLGYDHVTPRKARVMEPLETRILAALNIADPYEEQ